MRFIKGDSLKDAIKAFHQAKAVGRDPTERTAELRKLLGRFIDVCNAIEWRMVLVPEADIRELVPEGEGDSAAPYYVAHLKGQGSAQLK